MRIPDFIDKHRLEERDKITYFDLKFMKFLSIFQA